MIYISWCLPSKFCPTGWSRFLPRCWPFPSFTRKSRIYSTKNIPTSRLFPVFQIKLINPVISIPLQLTVSPSFMKINNAKNEIIGVKNKQSTISTAPTLVHNWLKLLPCVEWRKGNNSKYQVPIISIVNKTFSHLVSKLCFKSTTWHTPKPKILWNKSCLKSC